MAIPWEELTMRNQRLYLNTLKKEIFLNKVNRSFVVLD